MPSLVGNKPNQVPTNGDLGTLAFQDANAVNITGGNATLGTATATTANITTGNITTANISGGTATLGTLTANSVNLRVDHDISNISPSLLLDFANTKVLDPRITFTRATTATFYDGRTVAKAEENLLTYSQQINDTNGWAVTEVAFTANAGTAPDGTSTAELISETAVNNVHFAFTANGVFTSLALPYTFSVFLKKGTGATAPNIVQLTFRSATAGTGQYANFDISVGGGTSGTVTASADLTSSSITFVGNGWYRCSITRTLSAGSNSGGSITFCNNNPTATRAPAYLGVTTADVLAWGAQLEQRSAVTAYTPTTTEPITNYIPALQTAASGVARFDHNPITQESLGLLIEEQRTNLLVRSEEFDNASWGKNLSSVTSNTIVSPDGNLTGDLLIPNTTSGNHYVASANSTISAGATTTASVFVKPAGYNFLRLAVYNTSATAGYRADFNLSALTFATSTFGAGASVSNATITNVGNGWYRLSVSGVTDASSTLVNVWIQPSDNQSISTYAGNGFSGIFIWGAQLEAGAFPTSYIPTVASTVTRNADAASMTGVNFSSWYRAAEGTLYAECNRIISGGRIAMLDDGSTNNRFELRIINNIPTLNSWTSNVQDVSATSGSSLGDPTSAFKSAGAIKVNDAAISNNGVTVGTDLSCLVPQNLNRMFIGSFQGASTFANGTIKKLAYFPLRLPNAELIEMTT